jgi:hypothetical protein
MTYTQDVSLRTIKKAIYLFFYLLPLKCKALDDVNELKSISGTLWAAHLYYLFMRKALDSKFGGSSLFLKLKLNLLNNSNRFSMRIIKSNR